jgi:hypothetical protein
MREGDGWVAHNKIQVFYPNLVSIQGLCEYLWGSPSALPPGNSAKLRPPDHQDLVDGLEIKVQLGSGWKQDLTELSGGERYAHLILFASLSYLSQTCMYRVARRAIADHGAAAIQTCTGVLHPGRDRPNHSTFRTRNTSACTSAHGPAERSSSSSHSQGDSSRPRTSFSACNSTTALANGAAQQFSFV